MSKIEMLNLETGEIAVLFRASGAWIYYASISPDAELLAMSDAPPRESNSSSVRSLYTLSLEASTEPRELFPLPTSADRYTQAEWAPDGQSILFSAPQAAQTYQPDPLERLVGIQAARAHNVSSDWWSVPLSGGSPTRLTNVQTINLFASISPDQQHLASLSGEGIFVMDLDGSNLTQLVSDSGVHGTVSWIP